MSDQRKRHVAGIVTETGHRLMRFIRARVRSDADAEDIQQEVWERLIAALDEGPIEHVGAWLYTVARNRIIDRYRRPQPASLEAFSESEDGDDADFEVPGFVMRDDRTPETEHRRRVFWEQLQAALAELPKEQRQVFVWHEIEGLSFQDMVDLTGDNLNTLLSRKRYAVLHLRRRLERLREDFTPPPGNRISP